jgi:hypothetical protein
MSHPLLLEQPRRQVRCFMLHNPLHHQVSQTRLPEHPAAVSLTRRHGTDGNNRKWRAQPVRRGFEPRPALSPTNLTHTRNLGGCKAKNPAVVHVQRAQSSGMVVMILLTISC